MIKIIGINPDYDIVILFAVIDDRILELGNNLFLYRYFLMRPINHPHALREGVIFNSP